MKYNYYESFSEFVYINNNMFNNYPNIIYCNIRSINAHFDELLFFFWKIMWGIDVILLTEMRHYVLASNYVYVYCIVFNFLNMIYMITTDI